MSSKQQFIGIWTLLSCEHRLATGVTIYPFGEDAKGLLIYTADGYMSGTLSRSKRTRFHSRELFGGTDVERAMAMQGYLHYAGKFEVTEKEILHHVEFSLFPNWVGSTQRRRYAFDNGTLELSTGPFIADHVRQTAHLVWTRLEPS